MTLRTLLLLFTCSVPWCPAQVTLDVSTTLATPRGVINVVAGDVDADGHIDLLVSSRQGYPSTQPVLFFRGRGDLSFHSAVAATGAGVDALSLTDVDGDGLLDVIAMAAVGPDPLVVRLGQGDGTFSGGASLVAGLQPTRAAPGDFDGDGIVDMAILSTPGTSLPGGLHVAMGTGGGGFGPASRALFAINDGWVETADLDGDGLRDIVLIKLDPFANTSQAFALLSEGGGTFRQGATCCPLPGFAKSVMVGDVDSDGDPDVVMGFFGSLAGGQTVFTLLNDGEGALAAPIGSVDDSGGVRHALLDLDGDGILDVLSASTFGGAPNLSAAVPAVKVLKGNGDGSFVPDLVATMPDIPLGLAVADFDEDGRSDFVLGRANGGVAIVRNHTYSATGAYVELGDAKPGATGYPILLGAGGESVASPFSWSVHNARPSATASLILGTGLLDVPWLGGVLKPVPQFALGPVVLDASGGFSVAGTTPAAPGASVYLQWWVLDPDGTNGVAATNGMQMRLP
ncbi:MAG: VCBS repeat-containing protein [Planctomycetota bacterium]